MIALRRICLALMALCLWAGAVAAQDDDKDWLTRQIQNALSGAGRSVQIDGFEGALSSQASFDRLTIADTDGVWLVLEGAVLEWNRSALLRGRLEVEALTADRLQIARAPVSEDEPVQAEAAPFSFTLPDLPVSIEIAQFGVDRIELGAPLLGEGAALKVTAAARYTDTEAFADFEATRLDGKEGQFDIEAALDRDTNSLTLKISLQEAAEGLTARLLSLPGQPSVEMRVEGSGPLDDFRTDVQISTDGQERLAGEITLAAQTPRRASDQPDRRITADIGGDITALLAPRYRDFFGTDVQLRIDALREATGAVEVSEFAIKAEAAELQGQVTLNAESWPTFLDVSGTIASADGTPVLLPGASEGTTVDRIELKVDYDAGDGEALQADFDLAGFTTTGAAVAEAKLGFDGTLQGNLGSVGQLLGQLQLATTGIELSDPALAEAVGTRLTGQLEINYIEDQPLRLEEMDLAGTDYGLTGRVAINGFDEGFLTRLNLVLDAADLSRFSALAGQEVDGQANLALRGSVTPLGGSFDIDASGTTQDLRVGIAQADAVLAGRTEVTLQARRDENGTFLRDLALRNDALDLTGRAELRTDNSRAEAAFRLENIGLVVPEYDGPITVDAVATQDSGGWSVDASTDGPYDAALTAKGRVTGPTAAISFTADVPQVHPFAVPFGQDIEGPLKASGVLSRTTEGWDLDTKGTGPFDVTAAINGQVAPTIDVGFDASVPEINPLVPQLNGPVRAEGQLTQTDAGFVVDTRASGPYGATAEVEGLATGPDMALDFSAAVPNVNPLVPQLNGPARVDGRVRRTPQGYFIDTTANGPHGSTAAVEGLATGPDMSLTVALDVPDVSPLAPGVPGSLRATGVVRQTPQGIAVDVNGTGPYASRASVRGVVTGDSPAVDFNVAVANLAALVERVSGPLELTGSARKTGTSWHVETNAQGPAGTQARIAGQVAQDGRLDLDINGTAPLGLSRPFIAPRNLQGTARFDLALNGPAALSSLSGTVQTSGASLSAPNLRVALDGIAARIDLGGNRATIDATANASNGGQLRAGGAVTLTPALPADISVALQNVVLIDPRLYRTSVSGQVRVAGPLTGGARIAGQINVGETVVNVPSTGLTSIGDVPPITHIGATRPVQRTRQKAGLTGPGAGNDPAAGGGGAGFGLDLTVNAPNRIFVRGRGLDAELGGGLRLTGTTNQIISAGRFDLIRGRLDILGKRFDLREGSIRFQGDLVPNLRFVSATDTAQGEVRVIVEGPADAPEVTFESTPDAPQDEVLAQLLFGRNISEISAFQALQLASAVATLAGRGGNGIIGNLRDGFGLDDLDVTTTDTGATALRLGKYISDNVYTDVTASSDGDAEVSLNIDISDSLTARGTLESDGNTSIGIFFEKDY